MIKKAVKLVAVFFLYFGVSFLALGKEKFATSFYIFYQFNNEGECNVNYQIKIRNLTSDYYVSKYNITLATTKIKDLEMRDKEGILETNITKYENSTNIEAKVNEKVAGIDKVLTLNLNFKTDELAKKNGQVWEVNLPGLPEGKKVESYIIKVDAPVFFGQVLYVSPYPKKELYWTKENLGKKAVNIIFGKLQVFDFKLNYYLENKNETKLKETIALIPDTNYQRVLLDSLQPMANKLYLDNDGNWLADYILKPGEKLKVKAVGTAEVYWKKREDFDEKYFDLKKYLRPAKYWPSESRKIKEIARDLETVEEIYRFVINTFSYDYDRATKKVERFGALKALENRERAICMEYTDLFITLCRAKGVPAREIDGYAYTENPKLKKIETYTDVLHTWPQYYDYDLGYFRMVDPTWEDTSNTDYFNKFDLNHLAFAIRGEESSFPYPAGSYKSKQMEKTVEVKFGKKRKLVEKSKQLKVELLSSKKLISGVNNLIGIKVYNKGPEAVYDLTLQLEGEGFFLGDKKKKYVLKVGSLLPFTGYEGEVKVNNKRFLASEKKRLEISYLGKKISYDLNFSPFYSSFYIYIILVSGVIAGVVIFAAARKARGIFSKK